jgi:hypothetical protein
MVRLRSDCYRGATVEDPRMSGARQHDRDLVDAVREMLGLSPLYSLETKEPHHPESILLAAGRNRRRAEASLSC